MRISFNRQNNAPLIGRNPIVSLITIIAVIAFIVVFCVLWFSGPQMEQIADTNGADNYSLQTITDREIIDNSSSSTGLNTSKNELTKNCSAFSNEFSGIDEIPTNVYSGIGDTIEVSKINLKSGNIKFAVVCDGKIVHEFTPNEANQSYTTDITQGLYQIIVAGESADFEFDYKIK